MSMKFVLSREEVADIELRASNGFCVAEESRRLCEDVRFLHTVLAYAAERTGTEWIAEWLVTHAEA